MHRNTPTFALVFALFGSATDLLAQPTTLSVDRPVGASPFARRWPAVPPRDTGSTPTPMSSSAWPNVETGVADLVPAKLRQRRAGLVSLVTR